MNLNKYIRSARHQRGLSLVELSISLAAMGLSALVLWQYVSHQRHRDTVVLSSTAVERARLNLNMYAALHGRLPCPAANADGREACGRASGAGQLPWRTIGLPDPSAGQIAYTVSSSLPSLTGGAVFRPLTPVEDDSSSLAARPVALQSQLPSGGGDGVIDLCSALLANEPSMDPMAFSLRSGANPRAGDADTTASSMTVGRAQFGANLGCVNLMAVAGRSHFNAWLASSIMRRGLADFQAQVDIDYGNKQWNLGNAAVSLFMQVATNFNAVTDLQTAINELSTNDGTKPGVYVAIAQNAISLALGATIIGAQTSAVARLVNNVSLASDVQTRIAKLRGEVEQTNLQVGRHAVANASSAYFLAQQQTTPDAPEPVAQAMPGKDFDGGAIGRLATERTSALPGFP